MNELNAELGLKYFSSQKYSIKLDYCKKSDQTYFSPKFPSGHKLLSSLSQYWQNSSCDQTTHPQIFSQSVHQQKLNISPTSLFAKKLIFSFTYLLKNKPNFHIRP